MDDSFIVSDNEYLCIKGEYLHSSKCTEISSAPKAKKLKLENKCPPIGSDNLNNITHTRNIPFTSNTGLTDLFDDCITEADFFLKNVTKDMISYIVESTNEYAKLKKSLFTTSFSEILFFSRVHHLYGYIFTSRCYNVLVEWFDFLPDREIVVDEGWFDLTGVFPLGNIFLVSP